MLSFVMAQARESRPDSDRAEDETPVQSVSELLAAEVARTGVRRATRMPTSISTPPSVRTRDLTPAPPSSKPPSSSPPSSRPLSLTPQPIPTIPPVTAAPFAPPSLEDTKRILRGDYHPRAKVPSVRTRDDSFLGRLREGEPFIVGTVAFFGALLVAGIVFIVISLAAAH